MNTSWMVRVLRRLGALLSYASTAFILADVLAWDADGNLVRLYLEGKEPSEVED